MFTHNSFPNRPLSGRRRRRGGSDDVVAAVGISVVRLCFDAMFGLCLPRFVVEWALCVHFMCSLMHCICLRCFGMVES